MGSFFGWLKEDLKSSDEDWDNSSTGPIKRVDENSSLYDKETEITIQLIRELARMNSVAAKTALSEKDLESLRADNSGFPYDYKAMKLPTDKEGYVKSFGVEEKEEMKNFFDTYGVVVVHNCLSVEECKRSYDEIWEFVERRCSARRGDPTTWNSWPALAKLGILGNDTVLSKQFCENRQNPNLYKAFANILGSEKLYMVVGRASMMRPTKTVEGIESEPVDCPMWKTIENWLHWDANLWTGKVTNFGWKTVNADKNLGYDKIHVQAWVALTDCGPEDGGFHCVPGHHAHVRGWAEANKDKVTDVWPGTIQVPREDPIRQDVCRVPVRAGSLVMWSSYTAHGTFPNNSNKGRAIQYVKMTRAEDGIFEPSLTDTRLLPPDFRLSELGEKLLKLKPWE